MPLIHALLFGGNHSGSRAPCKETLAMKQLQRAKDSVSYHHELKQGASDKTAAEKCGNLQYHKNAHFYFVHHR